MTTETPASPSRRTWRLAMILIFVLAVVTRVAFLLEVRHDPVYVVPGHDEGVNDQVARAILAGRMPNSPFYKAPLYMYSLAGVYAVLGESPDRARWLQAVVFSAIPVLLAAIGRRLFGWLPGLIAGLIGAFYWGFVFYSIELVDTSLAALLYLVLGYLLIALPEGRRFTWLICGVALGLGAITRPNITACVPFIILAMFYQGLRRRPLADRTVLRFHQWVMRPLFNALAFILGAAVSIAPVTLHNRIVGGEWVPIATYGGLNAWSANSPWSNAKDGSVVVSEEEPNVSGYDPNNLWFRLDLNLVIAQTFAEEQLARPLTVGQADRFFYQRTTRYIRENPGKFITDTFKRLCWFFNGHEYCNLKDMYRVCRVSKVLAVLSYGHWGIFCPLAILGVICALGSKPRAPGMIYYLAVWVALLLGGAFFVMHSRFRLPPIYVLMPFAAYGLVRFGALWSRPTHWTKRLIGCGVLAGMGVFSNTNLFGYSNSVHTELQLTYAQACLETNRMDLLPEATRSFERAYWTEMAAGGLPWARTLQRQNPMTRLFECYDRLGDTDKALKYGRLMLDREPFVPANFRKFWKVFKKSSDEGEARRGLDVLERKALTAAPGAVIDCHRWFYDRFGDHSVLLRTEQLILRCMNQKPGDDYFITALKQVREQIDALGLRSSPASATSRSSKPGTGPERHAQ